MVNDESKTVLTITLIAAYRPEFLFFPHLIKPQTAKVYTRTCRPRLAPWIRLGKSKSVFLSLKTLKWIIKPKNPHFKWTPILNLDFKNS